jgi:PleD family two-component response regulator
VALNTLHDAACVSAERLVRLAGNDARAARGGAATVSVGVATFDPALGGFADIDALMRAADAALSQAKTGGRNRVEAA